jgi:hypothetical protein
VKWTYATITDKDTRYCNTILGQNFYFLNLAKPKLIKNGSILNWHDVAWIVETKFQLFFSMDSLADFRMASFDKKCDLVIANSNFIASVKTGEMKSYLYHTGQFFIEVDYSSRHQKIVEINAFDDVASMEPYIKNVSLADLDL